MEWYCMYELQIQGGIPLQGSVQIQGSKNAALPILAATLLTGDDSFVGNCPQIADVGHMLQILELLGCKISRTGAGIYVNSKDAFPCKMCGQKVTGMRSSICLLGAMLGRFHEVVMEHPGGCTIGKRPIDLHIWALSRMGVSFSEEEGCLHGSVGKLHGADLLFDFPSVGATENVILAAVMAEGETVIRGAAREPEITALCDFLCCCGARMEGIGTGVLVIQGGLPLHGCEYQVPSDRIVAGTYLFACVGCGGAIYLKCAPCNQLEEVIQVAKAMGASVQPDCEGNDRKGFSYTREWGMYVQGPKRPSAIPLLRTAVYPGFPTDLQSMALAVLTRADGRSTIEENIFENRFRVIKPLEEMGARLSMERPNRVTITGVEKLHGAELRAEELRGGAALVIAGLMAEGTTRIGGCSYIERGYENIGNDLRDLGARIVSVSK